MNNQNLLMMEQGEIIHKINIAVDILFSNDSWLLEKDLNERSISHKLAMYLQELFLKYNVDCEYNGNVDDESGRKRIGVLRRELEDKGLLTEKEVSQEYTDVIVRSVYPDIIIHTRGNNDNNLCIIEIKKSTNDLSYDYDELKLLAYTTNYYGNNLEYDLGIFIEFKTKQAEMKASMRFYSEGQEIEI
jgi:hypothetical protein